MQTRPHVEADWGEPELLDASINSAGSQYNSDLASDGYFYFGRATAPDAWGTYDFWRVPYEMTTRAPGEFNGDDPGNGGHGRMSAAPSIPAKEIPPPG